MFKSFKDFLLYYSVLNKYINKINNHNSFLDYKRH